ncbi:TPA: AHH domain-containing protein [Vibrio parahaemolyticus]
MIAFEGLKSIGVTDKDKIDALEKNLQAHHIITVDEMENNDFLYKKLPYLGYNLNEWHNVVVLPGIPELACFYEMPLHSGSHPTPYTDNVKRRLSILRNAIQSSDYCNETGFKAAELIIKQMKLHSSEVYQQIIQFRRNGALNYSNFNVYKNGNKGCCNMLKHSDIDQDSAPCRHRKLSKVDVSMHHDFRTTDKGVPVRVPYTGAVISELGY